MSPSYSAPANGDKAPSFAEERPKHDDYSPPTKRSKKDQDGKTYETKSSVLDVLSPEILPKSDHFQTLYKSGKPYPHGLIRNLFRHDFLSDVLREIKHNSKVKFKESDLFRVYQSIDLANLSSDTPMIENMPSLMKLREALYSPQYRRFVERVSDLEEGTLTGQVDCAANCHAKGCHLLCHDDVIGTRKVSYILYLTEPESVWTEEMGGHLELYDSKEEEIVTRECEGKRIRKVPEPFPSKTILPEFDSMAYFVVEPGVSFHSVQEVFGERPRLSIQGWYHAKETPDKMEDATLSRLKSTGRGEDTEGEFEPFSVEETNDNTEEEKDSCKTDNGSKDAASASAAVASNDEDVTPLSESDRRFLSEYINETYLSPSSLKEISSRFEEDSCIQLRHFFNETWSGKLKNATLKEDDKDKLGKNTPALEYGVGLRDGWGAIGPAHKQRFLEYKHGNNKVTEGATEAGPLLYEVKQKLFQSRPFCRLLASLTSLGLPLGHRGRIRRFRPGLDYTVAHYGILTTRPVLDATMCFAAGEGKPCQYDEETEELVGEDEDAIWESGDCGGFECYIAADETDDSKGAQEEKKKQEADDEYDEDGDTELLSVSASDNTLSLVYRDLGTMRFVKYVGAGAPGSRWDICLEYEVENDDEGGGNNECMEHKEVEKSDI